MSIYFSPGGELSFLQGLGPDDPPQEGRRREGGVRAACLNGLSCGWIGDPWFGV